MIYLLLILTILSCSKGTNILIISYFSCVWLLALLNSQDRMKSEEHLENWEYAKMFVKQLKRRNVPPMLLTGVHKSKPSLPRTDMMQFASKTQFTRYPPAQTSRQKIHCCARWRTAACQSRSCR